MRTSTTSSRSMLTWWRSTASSRTRWNSSWLPLTNWNCLKSNLNNFYNNKRVLHKIKINWLKKHMNKNNKSYINNNTKKFKPITSRKTIPIIPKLQRRLKPNWIEKHPQTQAQRWLPPASLSLEAPPPNQSAKIHLNLRIKMVLIKRPTKVKPRQTLQT